jgi:hypothetical protein
MKTKTNQTTRILSLFIFLFTLSVYSTAQNWNQLGIDIDGEAANDQSARSVSMNGPGDRMAVGAPQNGSDAGHVRVYEWIGTAWNQMGADLDGEAIGDESGISVSMNDIGDRLAIGARLNNGNGSAAGHVRIYEWNGTTWVQLGADIDGEAAVDQYGWSVSMNAAGDRLAIGALTNDGNGSNSGHVRIYEWNGTAWNQMGLDIDGEAANDFFGHSVSMNDVGNRLAVGARNNDGNGNLSGHVRIYEWNGIIWTQLGTDIDGEAAEDISGWSVSMNATGDRLAIGAPQNDGNGSISGHVRIYDWNGTAWVQLGTDIDGEAVGDYSGYSVSMNAVGDRLAIGARDNDGNGNSSGHVRVYEWSGVAWVQKGIDLDGEAANDQFGFSVSMNNVGDRLGIGAPLNDGNGNSAGHVRVYELIVPCLMTNTIQITNATCPTCTDGAATATPSGGTAPYNYNWSTSSTASSISGLAPGTYYVTISDASPCSIIDTVDVSFDYSFDWNQLGSDVDGEAADDLSGTSVSMNAAGDRMAIGAYGNDGNGNQSGHVRIYEWNGTTWVQLGGDIDGEAAEDISGWRVSMNGSGNRVAIGAYRNDGNGINSGHVRIYEWNGTAWMQMGADIDGEASNDNSGSSVILNVIGDRVAIGAYANDGNGNNSGHVRIYKWNGTAWVQLGSDIDGEAAQDNTGFAVSMNAAGDQVAIGAAGNSGNGFRAGHVRIYKWNGTAWIQMGSDIDGDSAEQFFGYSVSLNTAGDRVAIGAIQNISPQQGYVRIYTWNGTAWAQLGADIDGKAAGDQSGYSVSMNANGDRLAIGARSNDGNGNGSGHVRMYEWEGTAWVQFGVDLDGEASNDNSGWSVSMNAAGNRVAIGAPNNDGNGSNSGHVRVYEFDEPVPSNVQLKPASCEVTDIDPANYILSYIKRTDATNYRVRINGPGVNNVVHVSGNDNQFNINQIPGIQFGQSYTVEVAALINGAWSAYGTSCAVSTATMATAVNLSLKPGSCGITDIDPISHTLYYPLRTDATDYRVRVNGAGVNNVVHISGNDNRFNINQIAGIQFSQTYTVEVAAFIGGVWSNYGNVCNVSTASVATAVNLSLKPTSCGIIAVDPANYTLYYTRRADATDYRVRVNGAGVSNVVHVSGDDNRFNINQIAGIQFGQTYTVEVAAFINGQWSGYGTSCTVTTASVATAVNLSLKLGSCGNITVDPANYTLYYTRRADATDYRVRVNGPGVSNVVHVSGDDNRFNINQIAGIQFGQTYTVEVAAFIGGVWSNYGTVCNVTTVAFTPASPLARMKSPEIESSELFSDMSVYPNPSAQDVVHIKYNRNSDQSTGRVELEVFDISGKKIIKRSLSLTDGELVYDINTTRSMSAGIYIVRLVDGKMTKTEKLIIR